MYYYFYERSRAAILTSRPGGKGLNTFESILTGMIAGTHLTAILLQNFVDSGVQPLR